MARVTGKPRSTKKRASRRSERRPSRAGKPKSTRRIAVVGRYQQSEPRATRSKADDLGDRISGISLRGALRQELLDLLVIAVRALQEDAPEHHGPKRSVLSLKAAMPEAEALTEARNRQDPSQGNHVCDGAVSGSQTPTAASRGETCAVSSLGDTGASDDETVDDTLARRRFDLIKSASLSPGSWTPMHLVRFLVDKQAFDDSRAVLTKDLPMKDPRPRKHVVEFCVNNGVVQPVKAKHFRQEASKKRPSGRRIDSMCLTSLGQRGWELEYKTRLS
jgi:hypothetical protein